MSGNNHTIKDHENSPTNREKRPKSRRLQKKMESTPLKEEKIETTKSSTEINQELLHELPLDQPEHKVKVS
jgi:hypothetical protein